MAAAATGSTFGAKFHRKTTGSCILERTGLFCTKVYLSVQDDGSIRKRNLCSLEPANSALLQDQTVLLQEEKWRPFRGLMDVG